VKQFLPHPRAALLKTHHVRPTNPAKRALVALALISSGLGVGLGGCYRGFDVEDKEPPLGHPGGSCVQKTQCYQPNVCMTEHEVCYDPMDPCKGIYCGGNGTCGIDIDTNLPFCSCDVGYTNATYAYFCTKTGL
jgi:hypothetical protein